MRTPSVKVSLTGGFWTGLLSTVLGIVLTFGTSMLIEHRINEEHKQQYLICMVKYIDSQLENLVKDSVEAAQIDSIISPVVMRFSESGELPTRDELNAITPVFTSLRFQGENESFREYFEGNTETLQLLDSYTITQFNAISSTMDCIISIKNKREQYRDHLQNMLLAHALGGKINNEGYWKTVAQEILTNPNMAAFWMNNTEYRYILNLLLPHIRVMRACILSVHGIDESGITRYNEHDPYPAAWERWVNEHGALQESISVDMNDSTELTVKK